MGKFQISNDNFQGEDELGIFERLGIFLTGSEENREMKRENELKSDNNPLLLILFPPCDKKARTSSEFSLSLPALPTSDLFSALMSTLPTADLLALDTDGISSRLSKLRRYL